MPTYAVGPFLGVNNRLPPFALHIPKKGDFLHAAENVDIDNAGRIRSGTVPTKVVSLTSPHSLHMVSDTEGYLVRASALYRITLPSYTETLVKVLTSNAGMSYVDFAGALYFSNGTDSGRVEGVSAFPIGLPTPAAPAATAVTGGLLAGRYLVAVSHCRMSAGTLLEEGGISPYTSIDLSVTKGIRVTLPASTTGATHANIYLSAQNGSLPYLAATVTAGTASYDVTALNLGREARGVIEAPLPAGTLFLHNGRLCSFAGKSIVEGSPFRPGYHLPAQAAIRFPEDVSIAVSAQNGVFVAADKTYWFPGNLNDVQGQIADVLPYGAVPGTVFTIPDRSDIGWFGAMGIIIANTQGQASAVMNDNIDLVPPGSGTAAVLLSGGYMRVVSCGWCLNLENHAATAYTGWDQLTSVSRGYGTKADGIYSLSASGTVDAFASFGQLDLGTPIPKRLIAAYALASSGEPLELDINYIDLRTGSEELTFPARSCSDDIRSHRFDLALGMRASEFDITLRNVEGSAFDLAAMSFAFIPSKRRI
jgi:hypothetical protein